MIGFGFALCFLSSVGQTYFISLFGGEVQAEFGLSHGGFGTVYMAGTMASAATLGPLGLCSIVLALAQAHWLGPLYPGLMGLGAVVQGVPWQGTPWAKVYGTGHIGAIRSFGAALAKAPAGPAGKVFGE